MFKGEGSARPSRAELLQMEEIKPNFFLTLISFIRLTNLMNSGQRDTSEKKDVRVSGTAHFSFKTMYRPRQ